LTDPEDEILRCHTDAELSALYARIESLWRDAPDDRRKESAKAKLDKIAKEQDRRHPGFYK